MLEVLLRFMIRSYHLYFKFTATSLHSQANDSDIDFLGVQYHSPPPTALEGEQEEEEVEVRTCVVN